MKESNMTQGIGVTRTIVICEDDIPTLDLLCDHLSADGFGVLPASSAADARRLCRYGRPDLLLLDLSLPGDSGFDFLREIREAVEKESRPEPPLPIIVLTGRDLEGRIARSPLAPTTTYRSLSATRSCARGSRRSCGAATFVTRTRSRPASW
jgi:CheY-like chemotaxis protein